MLSILLISHRNNGLRSGISTTRRQIGAVFYLPAVPFPLKWIVVPLGCEHATLRMGHQCEDSARGVGHACNVFQCAIRVERKFAQGRRAVRVLQKPRKATCLLVIFFRMSPPIMKRPSPCATGVCMDVIPDSHGEDVS